MKLILLVIISLVSSSVFAEPYFVQCFDFGCKSNLEIRYSHDQWQSIRQIFKSEPMDSYQEKQAIRKAVAMMEDYSGQISGTSRDEGGNYSPGSDVIKQMDCIDESTNTFQYLSALEELDLVQGHATGRARIQFIPPMGIAGPQEEAEGRHGDEVAGEGVVGEQGEAQQLHGADREQQRAEVILE